MNIKLLKKLCDTPGMPGGEGLIRDLVIKELKNFTKDISIDAMGNVIARVRGKGHRLVLDAHTDEVGVMVHYIDDNGFIYLTPLGGMDPRVYYAQRLTIWGKSPLTGMVAAIPPHISKSGNNKEVPEIEDCVVDVGLSADKVKSLVSIGDYVSFSTELVETEDSVISKALDDRMGLFIIIEALRRTPDINCDLFITATVQEETGLRGARLITPVLEPDFVIAIEGTVAMDVPGIPANKSLANVNKGPEIRLSDRYLIADRKFSFFINELAKKEQIPCQITVKKAGGTNATAMQVTGKGSRVAAISVPTRYMHSPSSIAYKDDIENTIRLISSILENINKFSEKH